jgi:hypothetical protein
LYSQQLLATEERIAERVFQDTLRIANEFYQDLQGRLRQMESRLLEGGNETTITFKQQLSLWGLYKGQINAFLEEFFASKGFTVIPDYLHIHSFDDSFVTVTLEFHQTISEKIAEKFKEVLQENKDNESEETSDEETKPDGDIF